jgi:hypothetical protein
MKPKFSAGEQVAFDVTTVTYDICECCGHKSVRNETVKEGTGTVVLILEEKRTDMENSSYGIKYRVKLDAPPGNSMLAFFEEYELREVEDV